MSSTSISPRPKTAQPAHLITPLLKGKLFEDTNGRVVWSGKWGMHDFNFSDDDDPTIESFYYERNATSQDKHKNEANECKIDINSLTEDSFFAGHFYVRHGDCNRTRHVEKKLFLQFAKPETGCSSSEQSNYIVSGAGKNRFGKYTIKGTYNAISDALEVYRMYAPKAIRKPSFSRLVRELDFRGQHFRLDSLENNDSICTSTHQEFSPKRRRKPSSKVVQLSELYQSHTKPHKNTKSIKRKRSLPEQNQRAGYNSLEIQLTVRRVLEVCCMCSRPILEHIFSIVMTYLLEQRDDVCSTAVNSCDVHEEYKDAVAKTVSKCGGSHGKLLYKSSEVVTEHGLESIKEVPGNHLTTLLFPQFYDVHFDNDWCSNNARKARCLNQKYPSMSYPSRDISNVSKNCCILEPIDCKMLERSQKPQPTNKFCIQEDASICQLKPFEAIILMEMLEH